MPDHYPNPLAPPKTSFSMLTTEFNLWLDYDPGTGVANIRLVKLNSYIPWNQTILVDPLDAAKMEEALAAFQPSIRKLLSRFIAGIEEDLRWLRQHARRG